MDRPASTPRGTRGRGRGRGRGGAASARGSVRRKAIAPFTPNTEPPLKKLRYIPGGPGGGGRFIDPDGNEVSPEEARSARPRLQSRRLSSRGTPATVPARERSTRIRNPVNRDTPEELQISSAAAVAAAAAAAVQSDGYKPREERGWEEFHRNLDIEAKLMIFNAEDVDGVPQPPQTAPRATTPVNGAGSPQKQGDQQLATTNTDTPGIAENQQPKDEAKPAEVAPSTPPPPRRRPGRQPRNPDSFYGAQANGMTPKTPKVLPISHQNPKERLDLKQASYRKTDRVAIFESKTFGQARYVDKSMSNVGYQETDRYIRPERSLIMASDMNMEEEVEPAWATKQDGETGAPSTQNSAGAVGRVEYDMDEQDDMWLENTNAQRRAADLGLITREIFEITITKIEKEWYALEKRIPKPNPKPPQTHRPRSSSAAAVNGEPQAGEEQDSKCAICDDGDCENTNAIVFCDGCDLAVHQECYGVPFIPEGQWLCRKCQLIGRGIPTCIFCPNTDGAFKQTNASKWAHLLCAMWIPEVSLGNHTFMEPVMEVENVPKNRWKLHCYICDQQMGACIQCSNKNCYQAFHVTCARRCRLFLKMKNSQGTLSILDGNPVLKAFCDQHCPPDWTQENDVPTATKQAKKFYKRTMEGRIWADSQASAVQLAATHRHAITEHPPDESQIAGAKMSAVQADNKKKGQPAKPMWKLPSGAPIIPQAVYEAVESSLQRFTISKRKDFVAEACRYWTLKRESRRGAALLKRLQLQMETFSSMELTRRNFASMPSGKERLDKRIEFAETLMKDLEQLKELSEAIVQREADKLEAAQLEEEFVDTCYFPVVQLLLPVIEKALQLDKQVFQGGLAMLRNKLQQRFYTTTIVFARDLCCVIHEGINKEPNTHSTDTIDASPSKHGTPSSETKDRKRLGKRILKTVQKLLQVALQAEADITNKSVDVQPMLNELETMIEISLEVTQPLPPITNEEEAPEDVPMPDAQEDDTNDVVPSQEDKSEVQQPEEDADPVAEVKAEAGGDDADGDAMDIDSVGLTVVDANGHQPAAADAPEQPEEAVESASSEQAVAAIITKPDHPRLPNGITQASSPPHSADANSPPVAPVQPQSQPLTPPRSTTNGILPTDVLNNGGIPWYLSDMQLEGTTVGEEPTPTPEPEHGEEDDEDMEEEEDLSEEEEELSEMDDDTLNDLAVHVNNTNDATTPPAPAVRKGRSNPAHFRKGTRSSARSRR